MKKIVQLFMLLYVYAVADTAFQALPLEKKIADPDLIFAVTFDKNTVDADIACGNERPITLQDINLGLRGNIGFDGKQAFLPEGLEELKFEAVNNIEIKQGTITMWVCNNSLAPGKKSSGDGKRGNIPLFEAKFMNGDDVLTYRLADYDDGTNYFEWSNSFPPQGFGHTKYAAAAMEGFKKGQYYQLGATWTENEIAIYVNGELRSKTALPEKVVKTIDMIPDQRSYIGFRSLFYGSKNQFQVAVDDVKIYRRALPPVMLRNQYLALCKTMPENRKIEAFDVVLSGVDDGSGGVGIIEADYDFTPSATAFQKAKKRQLKITVTDADGKKQFLEDTPQSINHSLRINHILAAGNCQVDSNLFLDGQSIGWRRDCILIPDWAFAGNRIGSDDSVPPPWDKITCDGRKVHIWNREYYFGNGPLPEQILIDKQKLLKMPPVLHSDGKTLDVLWTPGKSVYGNSFTEFTGSGKLGGHEISYKTRVDFDGLICCDITMPSGLSMPDFAVVWQVETKFSTFLMTPKVEESPDNPVIFPMSITKRQEESRAIWLTSETGGFAFDYESDANWVYKPDEKIFSADRETGFCRVRLITSPVVFPSSAVYRLLYIATPTRPLPERIRGFRKYARSGKKMIYHNHAFGFQNVGSFLPASNFEDEMQKGDSELIYYSMADSICDLDPMVNFFRKYWDIPGQYSYRFVHYESLGGEPKPTFTLGACPACPFFKDYYLWNQKNCYTKPGFRRFSIVYYDLCGYGNCQNSLHGCLFKDVFGRAISRTMLLSKRDLVLRTLRLAHANGRAVQVHAQRAFSPMLHGLADYWVPGEQYGPLLARNSYGYTDEVPELLWQTEFNRNLIGTGLIMGCSIGWINPEKMKQPDLTEAMLSATLPYDIETTALFANTTVMTKIYDIFEQAGVYERSGVVFHRFDCQQELKISDQECRLSWYETPGGRRLLIVSNPTPCRKNLEITISGAIPSDCLLNEQYHGDKFTVTMGRFNCSIASRSFLLLFYTPDR